ncbi:MAG: MFS transporter, partial [Planctomycetes bacterium]|nr:MFS transporter [Planctomycetota bacterium]
RGTAARVAAERGRGFIEFLRSIHRTDLGRWTLVWAILHAGTMLAGPYFAPYMLAKPEEGGLGLTPVGYTVLVFTAQVVRMLMFPLAGRLVDHYGPSAMLRVAIAGIVVLPLGWALSTSFTVLIIAEICSGLAWCTAECAVGVLLLGCTNDPQDRARMIGYHQAVCCIVIVFTSTIGGQLLHILPPLDGSAFRALFIVSLFARIPALLLAIRFLPELKDPEKLQGLWRLIPGLQPTITLSKGLVRAFRRQ